MLFVEGANRIVAQAVREHLLPGRSHESASVDIVAADHHGVLYHVSSDASMAHVLLVSVRVHCFEEVLEQVGRTYLDGRMRGLTTQPAEEGYSMTARVDAGTLAGASQEEKEAVIETLSRMHLDVESAPLRVCVEALRDGRPVPRPHYCVHTHAQEAAYVVPVDDRVVVVLSLAFGDPTDHALATVFLQVRCPAQPAARGDAAPRTTLLPVDPPLMRCPVPSLPAPPFPLRPAAPRSLNWCAGTTSPCPRLPS